MVRDLDGLLPQEHPARAVWDFLQRLDLSAFYSSIKATVSGPGRPASDQSAFGGLALWVYATVEADWDIGVGAYRVGSARKLDRLCREHDAYRWICGGVPVRL